jgi:hypothetical protein
LTFADEAFAPGEVVDTHLQGRDRGFVTYLLRMARFAHVGRRVPQGGRRARCSSNATVEGASEDVGGTRTPSARWGRTVATRPGGRAGRSRRETRALRSLDCDSGSIWDAAGGAARLARLWKNSRSNSATGRAVADLDIGRRRGALLGSEPENRHGAISR